MKREKCYKQIKREYTKDRKNFVIAVTEMFHYF